MRFVGQQYGNPAKDTHVIINILCNDWVYMSLEGKALECVPLGYAFRLIFTPHSLNELVKKAHRNHLIDITKYVC